MYFVLSLEDGIYRVELGWNALALAPYTLPNLHSRRSLPPASPPSLPRPASVVISRARSSPLNPHATPFKPELVGPSSSGSELPDWLLFSPSSISSMASDVPSSSRPVPLSLLHDGSKGKTSAQDLSRPSKDHQLAFGSGHGHVSRPLRPSQSTRL